MFLPAIERMRIESLAEDAAQKVAAMPNEMKRNARARRKIRSFVALHSMIEQDSSFGDLRNGWMHSGSHGLAVNSERLANSLVRFALRGACVRSAVEEARAFAASRIGVIVNYMPVVGAKIEHAFALDGCIDFLPWSDVPSCKAKEFFGYEELRTRDSTSAVRASSEERQVLFSVSADFRPATMKLFDEEQSRIEKMMDVLYCLAVQKVGACRLGHWGVYDKPFLNSLVGTGYSCPIEIIMGTAAHSSRYLNEDELRQSFQELSRFDLGQKEAMRTSLDRFSRSLRRADLVDKAVDLGISLEMLLLHGIESHEELSYRFRLRGAKLLGNSIDEQRRIADQLKKTYAIRSKAVHIGMFGPNKKAAGPQEILEKGQDLCARIAATLIQRGHFLSGDEWTEMGVL